MVESTVLRDAVLDCLDTHRARLQASGVGALYLFGSVADGTATRESDIDLFFDPARPGLSLFDVMALRDDIAALLGRPVDIMTRGSLHPYLRPRIEAGAVRVF